MPVPAQRDPDLTRDILAKWLGDPARLPGARITDLQTPEFSGFSSETLMVDVECGDTAAALAMRVAPLHYKVFPETRFAEEYRLMRILDSGTDIPVPPVLWYEPDPGYLGAPFLVMRRIEGRVPPDMPPYHTVRLQVHRDYVADRPGHDRVGPAGRRQRLSLQQQRLAPA